MGRAAGNEVAFATAIGRRGVVNPNGKREKLEFRFYHGFCERLMVGGASCMKTIQCQRISWVARRSERESKKS
jgi:hypothetical protein